MALLIALLCFKKPIQFQFNSFKVLLNKEDNMLPVL